MDNYPINYKDPPTCDDYPIELGREVDPANRHPGVGYWLNDPFGGHYFPFSIPNDEDPGAFERTGACYIHLSDDKESLIGTLGKGYPTYGLPLYLVERVDEGNYNPPPPLSLEQLENFSPDSPLIPKIQEVLEYLRDHRLTAEVARTKWLLKNQKALREQVIALYKTAEPIEHHLLEVDMQLTSARRHLQSHQAYSKISSTWLHLHPLLRSRPTCHGIRRTVIDTARECLGFHFFCIILRLDPCRTGPLPPHCPSPTSSRLIGLMPRTPHHVYCLTDNLVPLISLPYFP